MINLKKTLSGLLVSAILMTSFVPTFAATSPYSYEAQAQTLYNLKLFNGVSTDPNVFDPALGLELDRQSGVIMMLRLVGEIDAAEALTDEEADEILSVYSDADQVADWAKKGIAYAVQNGLVVGTSATTVSPTEDFLGKMFAGLVLRNIGYEVTAENYDEAAIMLSEKGGLTAEEAIKFNDKELIRDDLVGMAYGSLKAAYAETAKTIIATLVDEGKVDKAKAIEAGLYEEVQGFAVTNGAKSITVKLNKEPADPSKVEIKVTRDAGLTVAANFVQDTTDKTVFTYTSSTNLTPGDYKVAVKDDANDMGSKDVKVEEEKLASIEITSNQIIRTSDTEGYVKYTAFNNYGEDVTKEGIASSIEWRTSLPSTADVDANKGTITITYGDENDSSYLSRLRDYTTTPIVISGYDKDSAITITKSLNASVTVGDIASIKLLGISNADGKSTIYRGDTSTDFYIDYEIKDSNGELITNYDLLSNGDALRVYPDYDGSTDPNIAAVEIVRDPNSSKDALFKVKLRQQYDANNQYEGVGVQPINFVGVQTGKSATIDVEVKAATDELATFILQRPAGSVVANSGWVEIPYLAYDSDGNVVADYNDINGYVEFSPESKVRTTYDSNGNFKLYFNTDGYAKDATVTLTATVKKTFKYSSINMTMKDSSTPDEIVAANFDTTSLTKDATYDFDLSDFTIEDKNGNTVDIFTDKTDYKIVAESGSSDVITVVDNTAVGANKILLKGGSRTGTANVTFILKDSENKELARKSVTFRNVDVKDIKSYGVETINKMYAVYPQDLSGTTTDEQKAYRTEIKVRGYLANGEKVYLPYMNLSEIINGNYKVAVDAGSFSVTNNDRFAIGDTKYVYAIEDVDGSDDAAGKFTATIMVDGLPRSVSMDLTSSETKPVAASITAELDDPMAAGDGYAAPVKSKGGDFYEVTKDDFNAAFAGKLVKFDAAGSKDADGRAAVYFLVKDSYGKEGLTPAITVLSSTRNAYSIDDEVLTVDANGAQSGDEIRLMASLNGVTKTIVIQVK